MTSSTQQHLTIKDIVSDMVILKDGSVAQVLQTSAVNFDLLSENEQLSIIGAFAGLLNSLSFPMQIMIRSKRLDISSYLNILEKAHLKQTNPLLKQMIERYRVFVETIIRENEVLDKQFYVVIAVSYLELGFINDINKHFQKAVTLLIPRRDHIIRQLSRIGLRATPVSTEGLIKLFYDIYNVSPPGAQMTNLVEQTVVAQPNIPTQPALITPASANLPTNPNQPVSSFNKVVSGNRAATPFVVEELSDDYAAS